MTIRDIVRAWRNPEYREARTTSGQAALPASPAGLMILDEDTLNVVRGAASERAPQAFGTSVMRCPSHACPQPTAGR